MEDFSKPHKPQAVMYTVNVVLSWKLCKMETLGCNHSWKVEGDQGLDPNTGH